MDNQQDTFEPSTLWRVGFVFGLFFIVGAVIFLISVAASKGFTDDERGGLFLLGLIMFIPGVFLISSSLKTKKDVLFVDGEGLKLGDSPKIHWDSITKLSFGESGVYTTLPTLTVTYKDKRLKTEETLKIKKTIQGFEVAVVRIIKLAPDEAKKGLPSNMLEKLENT